MTQSTSPAHFTIGPDDSRLRRLVALFHQAEGRPLGFRELLERGIVDPAQRLYELEISGYTIERVANSSGSGVLAFRLTGEPRPAPVREPERHRHRPHLRRHANREQPGV